MFARQTLLSQLAALGAPNDSAAVTLVHTSLRAVGETEGRGEGFLETLIEYFTRNESPDGGLLCIPTHTWAFLGRADGVTLDLNSSETCIGTLPTLAACHPKAHRSLHPTHSMAVFGDPAKAEAFIAGEVMSASSTSPKGCYGELYRRGGSVLLVGVKHNRDTYLHSVEEMLDVPNRLSAEPISTKIRLRSGDVIERPIRCHSAAGIGDVSRRYVKYEPAFRYHGCIRDGMLGNARVQLCSAAGMYEVMALIRERSGGRELFADDLPLDPSLWI